MITCTRAERTTTPPAPSEADISAVRKVWNIITEVNPPENDRQLAALFAAHTRAAVERETERLREDFANERRELEWKIYRQLKEGEMTLLTDEYICGDDETGIWKSNINGPQRQAPCPLYPAHTLYRRHIADALRADLARVKAELAVAREDFVAAEKNADALAKDKARLLAAIETTLSKNAHLADGEDCTLIALKRAMEAKS